MTTEEKEMLAALAKHEGLTSSDVVRLFIRRAYAETFGPKKSKK
jgi:antitoxin component of RelBE/YafQ-DinJ toxin-antitoxin module